MNSYDRRRVCVAGKRSLTHVPGIRPQLRQQLSARFDVSQGHIKTYKESTDGVYKFLNQLADGQEVESTCIANC